MEEDNAAKKTEATVSPEFLGDVDEHRHLSDREEDEEDDVAATEPGDTPVVSAVDSSEVVKDANANTANRQQDSLTDDRSEAVAAAESLPEDSNVHESFQALKELQKSLDDVNSAQLGNGNDMKSSQGDKEATSKAAGGVREQPTKGSNPNPARASKLKAPAPPKRTKLPRVAALQKTVSLPKDTYQPSKTHPKKMTSLPRVATLQKTRPVNTADVSSKTPKAAKKLTGLPRVAMLQRPSHHPPAQPHHPVSKQERDLLECQKKFKAKPLPKSLYSGTKTPLSSTSNLDEAEYMKPTCSSLAKVRTPVIELPHQDEGTTGPPKPASKKSPSQKSQKTPASDVSPPKTAKDAATPDSAAIHVKTGDELDELLGAVGGASPLPPSTKTIDQKSSPDDVQVINLDEGTTKSQEGTSATTPVEPKKLEFE